jgi:hypothetical protein
VVIQDVELVAFQSLQIAKPRSLIYRHDN